MMPCSNKTRKKISFILMTVTLLFSTWVFANSDFNYEKRIALVIKQKGKYCVSIANPNLKKGTSITLIGKYYYSEIYSLITAHIGKKIEMCNIGGAKMDDVGYRVILDPAHPFTKEHGYDFAVTLPRSRFQLREDGLWVDFNKDGVRDTFRTCTSTEGIHLTVWNGEPLVDQRMWHRYLFLGYDVNPSCTQADYTR